MMRRLQRFTMVIAGTMIALLPLGNALASPFAGPPALPANQGYFKGVVDNFGGNVESTPLVPSYFPKDAAGTPCVLSFIQEIRDNRRVFGSLQDKTGADFLIETMLGIPYSTASKINANQVAPLADWTARVMYYADNGWVDWGPPGTCTGETKSFDSNTLWQGNNGPGPGPQPNPDDDSWFPDLGNSTPDAIIFHNPGIPSDFYMIREACANPIGDANGLSKPSTVTLGATGGGIVNPGDIVPIDVSLINSGGGASPTGNLQIMKPVAVNTLVPGVTPLTPMSDITNNVSTVHGYYAASAIAGSPPPPQNWRWTTNSIPGNSPVNTGTLQVQISPLAVVGSFIVPVIFQDAFDPPGVFQRIDLTFTVQSKRTPGITGNNSDIHAGGGLCGGGASPGNITTDAINGASLGQYVVSANGAISGLYSNNSTPLTAIKNKLLLGKAAPYTSICRPDLVAAAVAGYNAASMTTLADIPATFDVTNRTGVFFWNGGGEIAVSGTVSGGPVTLVVPGGSVRITNNILLDGSGTPYTPRGVPSFGIISAGDILIDPAATQVNAYLFSDNNIDTCQTDIASRSQCAAKVGVVDQGVLQVNGFLMAKNIFFNRLGKFNSSGTGSAEVITLNPQIYLNPPKFFDSSVDDIQLQGLGERAPFF